MPKQIEESYAKLTLNFGKWCFAPQLKLSLITITLLIILVYLGLWQMDRAVYKKNIFLQTQQKANRLAIDLSLITTPSLENDRFTPINIDGLFLDKFTFLLDNQMFDHKVGFRVLTPVQAPKLNKWILIDRGWVPSNKNRQQLPTIEPIYGLRRISGIINSIGSGIVLKKDIPNQAATWPVVIKAVDYEFIQQQLQHPVFEFIVQLTSTDIPHFMQAPIDFGFSSNKHWGYALQWFLLAGLLLFYYVINSTQRRS